MYEGLSAIPALSITEQQHGAFAEALHLETERYTLALFRVEVCRGGGIRVHRMDQMECLDRLVCV